MLPDRPPGQVERPMSLKGMAKETVRIFEEGSYIAPSGQPVFIRDEIAAAVEGSLLYRPDDVPAVPAFDRATLTRIEVTAETTGAAARRLIELEGASRVAALNFASARNPGGGFLTGAKAQEEDLARCSALYRCLLRHRGYYEANRETSSYHYTDHVIYSPEVPFFRDERLDLLDRPYKVSILTAPAPNAGEILRRLPDDREAIRMTLLRRPPRCWPSRRTRGTARSCSEPGAAESFATIRRRSLRYSHRFCSDSRGPSRASCLRSMTAAVTAPI